MPEIQKRLKNIKSSDMCHACLIKLQQCSALACRFVLFTSSVEPSLQALSETWSQLGEVQQGAPILHGLVDIAEDQHLAERFSITNLPTFLLFRDRKVNRRRHLLTAVLCGQIAGLRVCTQRIA